MSWQHFYKDQQFDSDLWPCDLKIHREHQPSRSIHCTEFGNFQATGSKDIEQTLLSLQPNRQMQNNMPPFIQEQQKQQKAQVLHRLHTVSINKLMHLPKVKKLIIPYFYWEKKNIISFLRVKWSLLIKLESPLPKDALCQVWLKLAQWF